MTVPSVVILAAAERDERTLVGLTLVERACRAAVTAGIARTSVHVVRTHADLEQARAAAPGAVIVVRASDQVVMPDLFEAIEPSRPGARVAIDPARGDAYAGALRVDPAQRAALWEALAGDLTRGDRRLAADLIADHPGAAIAIRPTARHPAADEAERAAAERWLWQFVNKPLLDAPLTRYLYRPMARPLTRLFVRLPFTPNQITFASILIGQAGVFLASRPGYAIHRIGIAIMAFVSGLLDNVDGELARLRLEGSRLGAWLDAVSDDFLRLCLMIALGRHVAPMFPSLPIWPIAIATAVLTAATMVPMYWYCVRVLGTPNTQNYMSVLDGGKPQGRGLAFGRMMAGRDFVDVGMFVLAVAGLPIIAVAGFAIGAVAGFVVIIPAHIAVVRHA